MRAPVGLFRMLALAVAVCAPVGAAHAQVSLNVLAHLENVGDVFGADGQWVGTKGQSRRLEGFALEFAGEAPGVSLQYLCHLEDVGDTGWLPMGDFCGTRGESRRLEGFAIRLTGPNARRYSVTYSCHLESIGDVGPMRDGAFCGTRGQSRRLEALRVVVRRR